jgi:hypothetical protein
MLDATVRHFTIWSKREVRDSVHAKGMGMEKSENGRGVSRWIKNFMSNTKHCNTASVFVIFLCRSALVMIGTINIYVNGGRTTVILTSYFKPDEWCCSVLEFDAV